MDDISTADIPEYDFIDSNPSSPRHNAGQLQSTPKSVSHPKNTLTRPLPTVPKPNSLFQNKNPVMCEDNDSSACAAVPHTVKKASIGIKHQQKAAPHKSPCGLIPAAKEPNMPSSTKIVQLSNNNNSPTQEKNHQPPSSKANNSSDMEQIEVYQPLKSSQQTQDSVYEELNESTMKSTLANADDVMRDPSVYEPLQGNAQNPTYETLTLSRSSINVQL